MSSSLSAPLRGPAARRVHAVPRRPRRRHPSRRQPVRLTARGRAVVLIAFAVLAFGAISIGRVVTVATDNAGSPPRHTVVVEPGQTLWQIADEVAPRVDPRITVDRLIEMNGLTSAEVRAGQQLYVPAGGR